MAIISSATTIADAGAFSVGLGSMVHIKTLTASSSSTLSFVDGASSVVLDNTYPIYLFKFNNIHPSNDNAQFTFQTSVDSGSNYNTSLTSTYFYAFHKEDDSATAFTYDTSMDQANGTAFQRLIDAIGNLADESGCGEMYLFNPSSTTFIKHYVSTTNSYVDGTFPSNTYGAGYFNTTSAIDAVQFKMSAGTIDAGKIKLYGIKDS